MRKTYLGQRHLAIHIPAWLSSGQLSFSLIPLNLYPLLFWPKENPGIFCMNVIGMPAFSWGFVVPPIYDLAFDLV